ncbi:hypothetical protein TSUD_226990 [Trifolium subterraneum]|uniref:Uncharacterized protein n=1 Tax=Trifolium subterraneum TaxID=3900 RepID=A0A2Z6MC28_TRISU|nr:hypothetical protein TSUD_226990 [Trifolium subterraneum]
MSFINLITKRLLVVVKEFEWSHLGEEQKFEDRRYGVFGKKLDSDLKYIHDDDEVLRQCI